MFISNLQCQAFSLQNLKNANYLALELGNFAVAVDRKASDWEMVVETGDYNDIIGLNRHPFYLFFLLKVLVRGGVLDVLYMNLYYYATSTSNLYVLNF